MSNRPEPAAPRRLQAACGYEAAPGGNALTSSSSPASRRSASTWSRTNTPCAGRDSLGHMWVTTSTRMYGVRVFERTPPTGFATSLEEGARFVADRARVAAAGGGRFGFKGNRGGGLYRAQGYA